MPLTLWESILHSKVYINSYLWEWVQGRNIFSKHSAKVYFNELLIEIMKNVVINREKNSKKLKAQDNCNICMLYQTLQSYGILDYDSENMSSPNVSVWKHYLAGWETSNTLAILICNTTKVKDLLTEQTWKNNLLNKELRGTPKIDFLPLEYLTKL